jgi:hypothetical protein
MKVTQGTGRRNQKYFATLGTCTTLLKWYSTFKSELRLVVYVYFKFQATTLKSFSKYNFCKTEKYGVIRNTPQ